MKNNPLDDIVKCDISISNPESSDDAFDNILLVVPEPSGEGTKEIGNTAAVSTLDELTEHGFADTDPAYVAADIAFSQDPAPDKLCLCIRRKASEEPEAEYEPIGTTLDRADAEIEFYGFHLTSFTEAEDVQAAVEWSEKHEKLYGFEYTDLDACPVTEFSYYRSFGLYSGNADGYGEEDQPAANKYAALALMAKCFGYEAGSETWNLKTLEEIVPSRIGSSDKAELSEKYINTFLRYAGSNVTIGGYTLSGEWIDVIRFRDWLKKTMQERVFKAMKANSKVPFTDPGIGLVEGAMEAVLSEGQAVGGIAPTEYDEDNNSEIPGYTVRVPKSSEISPEERKSRKLTGCRYTARLAGAIHAVEIRGSLTF